MASGPLAHQVQIGEPGLMDDFRQRNPKAVIRSQLGLAVAEASVRSTALLNKLENCMNILSTRLALGGCIALALGSAPAMAENNPDGWFLSGNVGRVAIDEDLYDGEDTGYAVQGGYRWAVGRSSAIGVELGYNDLGNIELGDALVDDDPVLDQNASELHGWIAGANGRFAFTPKWYASARGGVYIWRGHGFSNDNELLSQDLDETSWYAGVGVGYNVTPAFSLGLNYDYYDAEQGLADLGTDMLSAGAEYRF